jgi:hypothetical protein
LNCELFEILKKSYGFIYSTLDGYYYLGCATFSVCTEEEITLYKEFNQEMKRLENCKFDLNKKDTEKLVDLVKKIQDIGNLKCDLNNYDNACLELCKFIEKLSEEDVRSIMVQHGQYIKALKYKNRALVV